MDRKLIFLDIDGTLTVAGARGYVFAGDKVLFDCPMKPEELEAGMRLLRETDVSRVKEKVLADLLSDENTI